MTRPLDVLCLTSLVLVVAVFEANALDIPFLGKLELELDDNIKEMAIDYALDLGKRVMESEVRKAKIPEFKDPTGMMKVYGVHVKRFISPRPTYKWLPPNVIAVGAIGGNIEVNAKWEVNRLLGQWGAINITTRNLKVGLEIQSQFFRKTNRGSANFRIKNCSVNVQDLAIDISGGIPGMFNGLLNGLIKTMIAGPLEVIACAVIRVMESEAHKQHQAICTL